MNNNQLEVKIDSTSIDGKCIITNFHYKFDSNFTYVLLGKSGSGKTTLYRIVSGLERRFSGNIKLNNFEIEHPSKKIQIVFQDKRLFPWKTVYMNLKFISPEISRKEATELLHEFDLTNVIDSFPKNLSGGEESRVSLLLTFLKPPDVLLLDEPFVGLDIGSQKITIEATKRLKLQNPSTLILLVTHNLLVAYELADKILILDDNSLCVNKEIDKTEISSIMELENQYKKYATLNLV